MKFLGSCRPFCNSLFFFVHLENQFYDSKFVYILCIKNPENNHDIAKEQKMLVTEYILLKTSWTKGQRAHRFGYQINM